MNNHFPQRSVNANKDCKKVENNELKLRMQALETKMTDLIQILSMKEKSLNTMASVQ